jgi:hypothetical protein
MELDGPIGALLIEAKRFADQHGQDPWDFAVELESLIAAGATVNVLRSLVLVGLATHAQETTRPGDRKRHFRPLRNRSFPARTCFILNDHADLDEAERHARLLAPGPRRSKKPRWDRRARTLSVADHVVKRFLVPAACQEAVLDAFEEEDWPTHVDDPLPPRADQEAKRRLHNTINALNRHHCVGLMRFRGNGNGKGVGWVWAQQSGARSSDEKVNRIATRLQLGQHSSECIATFSPR